jgi:hypothetical protein
MATFLRPDDIVRSLALSLGPEATEEVAIRLFDALVLRGALKPWQHGLWELEGLSAQQLQAIARVNE